MLSRSCNKPRYYSVLVIISIGKESRSFIPPPCSFFQDQIYVLRNVGKVCNVTWSGFSGEMPIHVLGPSNKEVPWYWQYNNWATGWSLLEVSFNAENVISWFFWEILQMDVIWRLCLGMLWCSTECWHMAPVSARRNQVNEYSLPSKPARAASSELRCCPLRPVIQDVLPSMTSHPSLLWAGKGSGIPGLKPVSQLSLFLPHVRLRSGDGEFSSV